MRKLVFISIVIAAFCSLAFGQIKYDNYTNDRFFFAIDYPSDLLKMQPPPENEDGRTFLSGDGQVEIRVWGQYNALSESLRQRYLTTLKGFDTKPSYVILEGSSFVISGVKEKKIVYIKTMYRKDRDTDIFYTLTIEYPSIRRKEFDPIVTRIANSFKIVPGADI
jgi:hypothetical protein